MTVKYLLHGTFVTDSVHIISNLTCHFLWYILIPDKFVFKMHLVGQKWHPGSTQCGWGINDVCLCFDVVDYDYQPLLFDLREDPYEDSPIPVDSIK